MNLHTTSLFSKFSLAIVTYVTKHMSKVCKMDLPNSRNARELPRLGANFTNINIGNRHVTHSQVRRGSQIPNKTEGSLLLPYEFKDSSDGELRIPYTTTSSNLYSPILDSSQYIPLCDADQYSTRMRCYFHHQLNHFIDYFNDPVPYGAVIYAWDVSF